MGQLADILRANLKELALSEARQLRELDKILKESQAVDEKLKSLNKWHLWAPQEGPFFMTCQNVPGRKKEGLVGPPRYFY